MATDVVLDLGSPRRWIDRHRHAAGQQYSEESEVVVAPRRKHDAHAVAGLEPPVLQARRHRQRPVPDLLVRGDVIVTVITIEVDLAPRGVAVDVPPEDVDERFGSTRGCLGVAELDGHSVAAATGRCSL